MDKKAINNDVLTIKPNGLSKTLWSTIPLVCPLTWCPFARGMSSSEDDILIAVRVALRVWGTFDASMSLEQCVVVVNNERDRAVKGRSPEWKWCDKEAIRRQ